jgi:tetratricopeptide (TPR) repeat protein
MGRRQEAVEQLKLAVQADPLNLMYRASLALSLIAMGRYDEAEEILSQSQDLDPNFMPTHLYLAALHIARQKFAEALPFAEKAFSLAPWFSQTVAVYAGLLVRTDGPDRGREIVRVLGGGEAYGASRGLAAFYTLCGDIDAAADWYERAIPISRTIFKVRAGYTCAAVPAGPDWRR